MQQLSFHCSAAERDNRIGTDKTATPRQRIQLVGSTLFFSFSLKHTHTHTATAAPTGSFWISKIYLSFEGEGAEKGGGDHRPKWEIFNPPLPAVTPLIRNQNPNINKREREREREREKGSNYVLREGDYSTPKRLEIRPKRGAKHRIIKAGHRPATFTDQSLNDPQPPGDRHTENIGA